MSSSRAGNRGSGSGRPGANELQAPKVGVRTQAHARQAESSSRGADQGPRPGGLEQVSAGGGAEAGVAAVVLGALGEGGVEALLQGVELTELGLVRALGALGGEDVVVLGRVVAEVGVVVRLV